MTINEIRLNALSRLLVISLCVKKGRPASDKEKHYVVVITELIYIKWLLGINLELKFMEILWIIILKSLGR